MTTIALRKYNELINSLIDQEKYQEAIGHCTAILNSYPKCIDTYQSLGRALLENKLFEEAEEAYSKILSVFPDKVIGRRVFGKTILPAQVIPGLGIYKRDEDARMGFLRV